MGLSSTSSSSSAPVTRSIVPVSGVPTEVLSLAAKPGLPALLQVLVVPGNPGNAHYYKSLMRKLHTALGGRVHVVSCSHAGHELGPHNSGQQLWSIEDQVTHKQEFIHQHLLRPGRPPLMVLAHSIGSYMAVHAVNRLDQLASKGQLSLAPTAATATIPDAWSHTPSTPRWLGAERSPSDGHHTAGLPPIVKVVALMPFFQADFPNQWEQRFLRALARRYRAVSALTTALAALPLAVRAALVNWWTGSSMTSDAVLTTCRLLHPATILNNFYMAHTEFIELDRPFDWGLLASLGSRLHVVACPKDPWMSAEQHARMLTTVRGLSASWHPTLEHAFCVSERQCDEVARLALRLATPYVTQAGSPELVALQAGLLPAGASGVTGSSDGSDGEGAVVLEVAEASAASPQLPTSKL